MIKRILRLVFALICLAALGFAVFKLLNWHFENEAIETQVAELIEVAVTTETSEEGEPIEIIDFSVLKSRNSDTVAWLKIPDLSLSYAVVQASDNSYYLDHSFDRTYNTAGWVFMDFRNDSDILKNKNTIFYAHGRQDGSMFGSLKKFLGSAWRNKTPINFETITESAVASWQVFSVYRIPVTSDYLAVDFASDAAYQKFLKMLADHSVYNGNVSVDAKDQILTLSTCYNDNERLVVHAKLLAVTPVEAPVASE